VPSEVAKAAQLGLPNYRAVLHNKYSKADADIPRSFDFIVDNNPTTFCCCIKHLGDMVQFYASRLGEHGQLVTDRVGLGWAIDAPGSNPRWAFDFDDLTAVASLAGLKAYRVDRNIYVVSRKRPVRPPLRARAAHVARSWLRRLSRKLSS
jgi:hypothetical protein